MNLPLGEKTSEVRPAANFKKKLPSQRLGPFDGASFRYNLRSSAKQKREPEKKWNFSCKISKDTYETIRPTPMRPHQKPSLSKIPRGPSFQSRTSAPQKTTVQTAACNSLNAADGVVRRLINGTGDMAEKSKWCSEPKEPLKFKLTAPDNKLNLVNSDIKKDGPSVPSPTDAGSRGLVNKGLTPHRKFSCNKSQDNCESVPPCPRNGGPISPVSVKPKVRFILPRSSAPEMQGQLIRYLEGVTDNLARGLIHGTSDFDGEDLVNLNEIFSSLIQCQEKEFNLPALSQLSCCDDSDIKVSGEGDLSVINRPLHNLLRFILLQATVEQFFSGSAGSTVSSLLETALDIVNESREVILKFMRSTETSEKKSNMTVCDVQFGVVKKSERAIVEESVLGPTLPAVPRQHRKHRENCCHKLALALRQCHHKHKSVGTSHAFGTDNEEVSASDLNKTSAEKKTLPSFITTETKIYSPPSCCLQTNLQTQTQLEDVYRSSRQELVDEANRYLTVYRKFQNFQMQMMTQLKSNYSSPPSKYPSHFQMHTGIKHLERTPNPSIPESCVVLQVEITEPLGSIQEQQFPNPTLCTETNKNYAAISEVHYSLSVTVELLTLEEIESCREQARKKRFFKPEVHQGQVIAVPVHHRAGSKRSV
ncbi:hypothetical protein Aperf_G00000065766 [Anoplocephala perfoliata]